MPRDISGLWYMAGMRWPTTEQLLSVNFPKLSPEVGRRRLRVWRAAGYIKTWQDHRMVPSLHTLTAAGRQVVIANGWEGEIKIERKPPKQLKHLIGINDIRVAVECGVRAAGWRLGLFFADWQLEAGGWPHKTIPDAICAVDALGHSETVLFEFDRGTEGRRLILKDKLIRYTQGLPGVEFSQVIFVTETQARAAQLARLASKSWVTPRFSFVAQNQFTAENLPSFFPSLPVASPVATAQHLGRI